MRGARGPVHTRVFACAHACCDVHTRVLVPRGRSAVVVADVAPETWLLPPFPGATRGQRLPRAAPVPVLVAALGPLTDSSGSSSHLPQPSSVCSSSSGGVPAPQGPILPCLPAQAPSAGRGAERGARTRWGSQCRVLGVFHGAALGAPSQAAGLCCGGRTAPWGSLLPAAPGAGRSGGHPALSPAAGSSQGRLLHATAATPKTDAWQSPGRRRQVFKNIN